MPQPQSEKSLQPKSVGTLDALKAVGNVDSASYVDAASWQDRIPTAEELKPIFELAGYNPYPDVPSNTIQLPNIPTGDIVQQGLPNNVFSHIPGVDSQTGKLPNINPYLGDLGRKEDGSKELDRIPGRITISEILKQQLEDIQADDTLRTTTENIGLDRSQYSVAESARKKEFDDLSKNGIFGDGNGGGGLFEYAGPMIYPSTAGIVFLKRLERPSLGKIIEERSIRLLAEEERIKSEREAHIRWLMGNGYSEAEARKIAYAKYGEGYYEHQERVTVEQNHGSISSKIRRRQKAF